MRNVRKNFLNSENSKTQVSFLTTYSFEFPYKPLNKPLKQVIVSQFDSFNCIGK